MNFIMTIYVNITYVKKMFKNESFENNFEVSADEVPTKFYRIKGILMVITLKISLFFPNWLYFYIFCFQPACDTTYKKFPIL